MFYKADSELGDKLGQKIGVPSVKSRLWLANSIDQIINIISFIKNLSNINNQMIN